jgi:hypothetical protein
MSDETNTTRPLTLTAGADFGARGDRPICVQTSRGDIPVGEAIQQGVEAAWRVERVERALVLLGRSLRDPMSREELARVREEFEGILRDIEAGRAP